MDAGAKSPERKPSLIGSSGLGSPTTTTTAASAAAITPSSSSSSKNSMSTPLKPAAVVAGSFDCPFRLAIVGGGPSGCSIMVRAVRIGMVSDLCSFSFKGPVTSAASSPVRPVRSTSDSFMKDIESSTDPATNAIGSSPAGQKRTSINVPKSAGVVLFDSGPLERLGGGRLQDYVINSNTWIGKFASQVLEEKPDNLPPELVRGSCLERLSNYNSTKELVRIGNKTGSLVSAGIFLKDVGQVIYSLFQQYPDSSKCLIETKVEKMTKCVDSASGKFLMWKITYSAVPTGETNSASRVTWDVHALHVVLSTGGHQKIPKFANPSYNAKTISSDVVCTEEGVKQLKDLLVKTVSPYAGAPNTGRVAIIGGSHSAFSAAWILLNRVEEVDKKHDDPTKIKIGPSGVCILYRSPMKVFYATKAEADHDHYNNEGPIVVNKVTGQINPFGGIRGDAKDLWRAIRTSREPRVRLLHVKSNIALASSPSSSGSTTPSQQPNAANFGGMKQSIVDKILDEAAVIIWACGYAANSFPIIDPTGNTMRISMSKGQVDVDDQARILYEGSNLCVENLYGSGLGYGLKATLENGDPDGSSGRADGVAVYLKRGATLVLAQVLGNRVYGGVGISSWEERNKLLRKQNVMLNATSTAASVSSGSSDDVEKLSVTVDSPTRIGTALLSPGNSSRTPSRIKGSTNNQATPMREHAKSAPTPTPSTPSPAKKSSIDRRPASAGRGNATPNRVSLTIGLSATSSAYQALKAEAMIASPAKGGTQQPPSPNTPAGLSLKKVSSVSNSAPNTPHRADIAKQHSTPPPNIMGKDSILPKSVVLTPSKRSVTPSNPRTSVKPTPTKPKPFPLVM